MLRKSSKKVLRKSFIHLIRDYDVRNLLFMKGGMYKGKVETLTISLIFFKNF